jgi:regulator of replication initiation timing
MSGNLTDKLQKQLHDLQKDYKQLMEENNQLRKENNHLKSFLNSSPPTIKERKERFNQEHSINIDNYQMTIDTLSNNKHKIIKQRIALFRDLFRGREDVYPIR